MSFLVIFEKKKLLASVGRANNELFMMFCRFLVCFVFSTLERFRYLDFFLQKNDFVDDATLGRVIPH